jgi:hypothetical protein
VTLDDPIRFEEPLLSCRSSPLATEVKKLLVARCTVQHAVELVRAWHRTLPRVQDGPWMYAFRAECDDRTYAVALWNNPSARTLPGHWVELRRMAVSTDAPRNTASMMLGAMVRWLRKFRACHERCISYADADEHTGSIYKAANWTATHTTARRQRDRSTSRPSGRLYRWSINGAERDSSPKVRWEITLRGPADEAARAIIGRG